MTKKSDWRDLLPHPWPDDFDKETAWDFIGLLTLIVAIETSVIIALILYIVLVLL